MEAINKAEWHTAACIFPMLPDHELHELSEDIRTHGQREPIVMFEGKVLDGRNRWLACKLAGVIPKTRLFSGTSLDALNYVWSVNVKRRHLNSGQTGIALAKREKLDAEYRAAVEAIRKAAPKNQHDKKSAGTKNCTSKKDTSALTDHKLAEAAGTNRTYLNTARKVVDQAPELAARVERGEMTLPQAAAEMRRDEKRRGLEEKSKVVAAQRGKQKDWQLIHADVLVGLRAIKEKHGQARLIFADPPYNIGVNYGKHHNDSMRSEDFLAWCLKWMNGCCDCLTDDGSLWVMINDEYAADFVMNLRDCHLTMRSWIKWYETFGVNCSNNFNRTSRHILYFVMDEDRFVFNETEVLQPSARQSKYNDSRAQSSGKIIDDVWTDIPRLTGTSKERVPDFPTQLPVALLSRIVACASEPGDLVVDPFNGSGTTGVAAIQSGRRYVGIEASSEFITLAGKRLEVAGAIH